jgi:hypothetical protein
MDQLFAGFFAAIGPTSVDEATSIVREAKEEWTGCRGRMIYEPYAGVAVSTPPFPRFLTGRDEKGEAKIAAVAADLEERFPEWTRRHPNRCFVFIRWEQEGVETRHRGFVCKDGRVVRQAEGSEAEVKELLQYAGVRSAGSVFVPLQHHFYW